jgi:V/A-type H+-transporting ATPase subunit I
MNLTMIPVEIVGLKSDLPAALHALRRLGCVHIDDLAEAPQVSARPLTLDREALRLQEELSFLVARIDGLLEMLGQAPGAPPAALPQPAPAPEDCLAEARAGLERLVPEVQALTGRREKLQAELASLPRYEGTLRQLLPIIPPSAHQPGNVSVGVLVSRAHIGILDSITREILESTNGRAEVVASDVDAALRAMLIVFPEVFTEKIETILGHEDVSRLRLPAELGGGPPDVVLETLRRRMSAIPAELQSIEAELIHLAALWREKLAWWSACLHEEIDTRRVLPKFGETDMTFILAGWIPGKDLERVKAALREALGEAFLLQALPLTPALQGRAPVVLQNPPPARPFESLVNLLSLPRYGHIDPTTLMAFFLPIFFGMILGDVGYGVLLLGLSLVLFRKYKKGTIHDILIVLAMGSGWGILFGFLYGEAFGALGETYLGMHALWFERASAENMAGLLIMTIVVGAVHVTLGLILGVWEAAREKSRSHLLERGGMLLGLIGLFLIVGVLTHTLPQGLMSPAVAGMIVGIVLLGASLGWLGVLMGPIEFIGLIGNVLSYLRIAAIGLASVYLAKVANDMAGSIGNLVVGVIIAVLIHALNLVLGAFSPTIHSLRLHYVEFFRKFYEGGGRHYEPFKSRL